MIAFSCQALPLQAQVMHWLNMSNTNSSFEQGFNWNPGDSPGPGNVGPK